MKKSLGILSAIVVLLCLAPSPSYAATSRSTATDAAAITTTRLTLRLPTCEMCLVGVASYILGSADSWSARPKRVKDGVVTFRVPTDRTDGLSITVRAPWEGATGYVTNVALRYKGHHRGERVGFKAARAASRASACWAGTDASAFTIKVKVRKVTVQGYGGKVAGTIAWAAVTQAWQRPVVATWHGVVGTQDVMPCKGS